jgi:hypothetical protein
VTHYRIYKLNKPRSNGGKIIHGKDLLAPDDQQAMHDACEDPDCPICEVWQAARKVGSIESADDC